jgi:hypothetical protein
VDPQDRSVRVRKISPSPTGIGSPDLLSRNRSLYRLRHTGPLYDRVTGDDEMPTFQRHSSEGNSYAVQSEQLIVITQYTKDRQVLPYSRRTSHSVYRPIDILSLIETAPY